MYQKNNNNFGDISGSFELKAERHEHLYRYCVCVFSLSLKKEEEDSMQYINITSSHHVL
jgi:predicted adenine nucleotide alpha hydrolase (AANH) superfamily ATPase